MSTTQIIQGDCLNKLKSMKSNSVSLVIGSPPYHGKMNRYGGKRGKMSAVEWAEWMADIVVECVRVSAGRVMVIANGCVQKGVYQPSCERLIVACADRGVAVDRPVIWHKNAPPNRRDWFGNDWEFCLAFGSKGEWNWEAIATPKKFKAGGDFHQRTASGKRRKGNPYPTGALARPRDVLRVTVGGGHLGSKLAHENEAPFPEKLVLPFVLALTNEGDTVLDPFCGSGTTLAVAGRHGRNAIGIDNRRSQVALTRRRLAESAHADS